MFVKFFTKRTEKKYLVNSFFHKHELQAICTLFPYFLAPFFFFLFANFQLSIECIHWVFMMHWQIAIFLSFCDYPRLTFTLANNFEILGQKKKKKESKRKILHRKLFLQRHLYHQNDNKIKLGFESGNKSFFCA